MPYRRLPNTDTARLRALKSAFTKGKEVPPFKLAYSQSTFQRVSLFLPSFEQSISQHNLAYKSQTTRSKEYQSLFKKAKMYISHFIQVVNMAIARGEMKEEARNYYGLAVDDKKLPSLVSEHDIIEWGKKLITGEMQRKLEGGTVITNPTIAVVKVKYETFVEAYNNQKTLQKNTQRALNELTNKRMQADEIILDIWNEVESSLNDLNEDEKRENAKEYGLVYVYRKNEIGRLDFFTRQQIV